MARKSQARKARKNTTFDKQYLAETTANEAAIKEGPKRKKWVDPRDLFYITELDGLDVEQIKKDNDEVADEQND
jgi:hypothetical protein